jgi:hypothetical protein
MNDGQEDFQAPHSGFKTLLPYVREQDQLLRDHPGLLKTPLERTTLTLTLKPSLHPTALHYLCKILSSPNWIQCFIDMCPDTLNIEDSDGHRPLALPCMRGDDVPLQTVLALAEKNPDAFQISDNDDWVPLHDACLSGAMIIVSFLATRFPEPQSPKDRSEGDR